MPCRTDDCEDTSPAHRAEHFRRTSDAATRAACEMRKVLRDNNLIGSLSAETQGWVKKHDREDAKREQQRQRAEAEKQKREQAAELAQVINSLPTEKLAALLKELKG